MRIVNRTLYVSDLDGTLLDESSRVSVQTAAILNPLIDKGLMFTVATARTPATVDELLRPLHAAHTWEGAPIPAIVMTGAGFWNLKERCFSNLRLMSARDSEAIAQAFASEGVNPFVYCLGEKGMINVYHPVELTEKENNFYQERRHLKLKRFHLGQKPSELNSEILYFAIGTPEKMERICSKINATTGCAAAWYRDIFNPSVALMDVYAPGCSKAQAVKDLAQTLGCDRIVVFGDNLNDLPMMAVADLSVAMENALPEVKAKADVVIGPNTRPSVAEFIRDEALV